MQQQYNEDRVIIPSHLVSINANFNLFIPNSITFITLFF